MPKTLSPREELLKIQKRIYAKNNEFIRSQTLIQEKGFDTYERRYKRYVQNYAKISSIEELIEEVMKSQIIYLGDYHTNKQSQRMLLRLLKLLTEKTQNFSVGLELVQKRDQKILDAFLKDQITEETFLKKIRFQKYWYFDLWQNFKPLFDFVRYWKIPVYGIEWSLSGDSSLLDRDKKNAQIIASILKKDPTRKLIVFIGDLHIAPPHLPNQVQTLFTGKEKPKDLILYQNSEAIYWKLAERELEDKTEILRIDERSFCLINTPPIIAQQSYLNWLEHEEGQIDYIDAKHNFLELLHQIAGFLEITLEKNADEVEVFTCGDLSFLKRLEEDGGFSKQEIRQIKRQILASESYCIPSKKYVYLANLSMNHASEEATHYLKFLCSGTEEPRYLVDAFYANTLHEALGFFGSKIINHKRKCFHEKEYEELVQYLKSARGNQQRQFELEMALLILEHKKLEKKRLPLRSKKFFKSHPDLFFAVTHGLGYMLGDTLYYSLLEGKTSKEELKALFFDPMKEDGKPYETYMRLIRKLRGVKIPKRV
ncbi:MAG: ChaN family lipoprotein [Deltaproteobacteria bacterium]|nr:ChaN family lipoprotein [Deltaproteobacteria bacterium]